MKSVQALIQRYEARIESLQENYDSMRKARSSGVSYESELHDTWKEITLLREVVASLKSALAADTPKKAKKAG